MLLSRRRQCWTRTTRSSLEDVFNYGSECEVSGRMGCFDHKQQSESWADLCVFHIWEDEESCITSAVAAVCISVAIPANFFEAPRFTIPCVKRCFSAIILGPQMNPAVQFLAIPRPRMQNRRSEWRWRDVGALEKALHIPSSERGSLSQPMQKIVIFSAQDHKQDDEKSSIVPHLMPVFATLALIGDLLEAHAKDPLSAVNRRHSVV